MNEKDKEYWEKRPLEEILQQWHDCIENGEVLLERIDKAINYIEEKVPQSMCLPDGVYDTRNIDKIELLNILKGEK